MDQSELTLTEQESAETGPVECLGKTFANDEERRAYFLGLLAEKLKDPEFRKIEGFPIGEDEDILNLSDPPYYTACPNPFIDEFVELYGRPYDSSENYNREPYAADVSEGKTDSIYRAHSYHTKVPHKALMRYILHYTSPGDLVFDGFCGSGMAGVAAQMCGDKKVIESLGYRIDKGQIFQKIAGENGESKWESFSMVGERFALISDLSPAATFIASKYCIPFDLPEFTRLYKAILDDLHSDIGWMYETYHTDRKTTGKINFTVWSDVFSCHQCGGEIIFLKEAFNREEKKVLKEFACPTCSTICKKEDLDLLLESKYDDFTGEIVELPKRIPVFVNYSVNGKKFEKDVDDNDLAVLSKINELQLPNTIPKNKIPNMQMANVGRMKTTKTTHINSFFLPRQAQALGIIWDKISSVSDTSIRQALYWVVEQSIAGLSILNRYQPAHFSQVNRQMAGVFYVPSQISECSPWYNLTGKFERVRKAFSSVNFVKGASYISTGDCSNSLLNENSLDYIFTDPPFGENIYYSDLNYLPESWHKVFTNSVPEAIVDRVKKKTLFEYHELMEKCFREYYRVLKPGRWITVEFSNTKASVWNGIQTAMANAGFIIGNVSALDKKQNTFQAVNSTTAVKQDLVISAYKPNGGFEARFTSESDKEGVWDFVGTHLGYLPISKKHGNALVRTPERDPRILFDQVVAYFVRSLRDIPISSKEFQDGLTERFVERDGMFFLPEQVAQYDKARITSSQLRQLDIFVDDEASSIEWLRQQLNDKPQTYQDIHPKFINELSGWKKAEVQLELSTLLDQNFIKFDGKGQVPPQIHSYLSTNFKDLRNLLKGDPILLQKAKDRWYVPNPEREEDLQKLRERGLLKQFEDYKSHTGKKLKLVRVEAVRCGFKKAWQDRDYATIINVAEKIPQNLLQEDQKLLMWYDQAQTRSGDSF